MKFYKIHPEVPGGLGINTLYNKDIIPWKLVHLHAIFDGWLGGNMLKISNCYLVTEQLKIEIEFLKLTGVERFQDCDIEVSNTFKNLYPNLKLPKFHHMVISGIKREADFGMIDYYKLAISEKALSALKKFDLSDMEIEDFIF
jgi:hypothetical protein